MRRSSTVSGLVFSTATTCGTRASSVKPTTSSEQFGNERQAALFYRFPLTNGQRLELGEPLRTRGHETLLDELKRPPHAPLALNANGQAFERPEE